MRLHPAAFVTCAIIVAVSPAARSGDPDQDGDTLPDFQEVHKYDKPGKKDTAGKGSDGDGATREFS